MIKRLLIVAALLFAAPAFSQQLVNCNAVSLTPCNTSVNPGSGTQGDPAWLAFGKLNADILALYAGAAPLAVCPPFTVLGNTTSSSAAPICVNSIQVLSVVAPTGGSISAVGSGINNANQISGTTIPVNAAGDQALTTSLSATGQWTTLPGCLDAGGNHLNYNNSTHAFTCGNTGGAAGSVAFGNITGAPTTNTNATMIVGTGATLSTSGSGTITANAVASGTSLAGTVSFPYATGGTGLLPIANGGNATASPGLVAGTNITITGSWPNYTINATNTAATAFSSLTTSDNTICAPCRMGTGATLSATGTGKIVSTSSFWDPLGAAGKFLQLQNTGVDLFVVDNVAGAITDATGTVTLGGQINIGVAGTNNVNVLTGASVGVLNLNNTTGTGNSNLGNQGGTTVINGAPVNINPGTVAGNVNILQGTSETGTFAALSGTTPTGAVSLGRTTSGNINIGDVSATGTISIGNTTGPTNTAMAGTLAQTGVINANVGQAFNINLLSGASSGNINATTGTASGTFTLGNAASTFNMNAGTVGGSGWAGLFASPPALGGTAPAAVHATTLTEAPAAAATTDAGNVGYVGMQSGVPFIISSGCTTSAGGALTACPTYPNSTNPYTNFPLNVLMWFPAATVNTNAGQIGNAVGWYWVQLATSTTGQICTEGADAGGTHAGYQSGSPVVPGTCTHPTAAIACSSGNACLNGNAQVIGPNFTLPAHALGKNGRLEYNLGATTDGAAQVKTLKTRVNNAQIGSSAVPTTTVGSFLDVHFQNAGAENANVTRTYFPTSATANNIQQNANIIRTVVDTTVSNPVDVTLQVAAGGADFVLETYTIKVFPN